MMIHCPPPSRWWRREKTLRITLWPQWLAQRLCWHPVFRPWIGMEGEDASYRCEDCYKIFKLGER